MQRVLLAACLFGVPVVSTGPLVTADDLPWVTVSRDAAGFSLSSSGKPFAPWGFNYDRDDSGRLIEDYWLSDWAKVERDFRTMKQLGATVVRVHLQLGRFIDGPDKLNDKHLVQLDKLLALAEAERLYLDLTGLGCYHKKDVPGWYDMLSEKDRWAAQALFWQGIAGRCAKSPAVFCYDLMNEPFVPGGRRAAGDWLGPAFAGKHYTQFITLDQADRPRVDIACRWIDHLSRAIRQVDRRHLITVGLVDASLDRPGITSGFIPDKVAGSLDFVSVHLYPEAGKLDEAAKTLKGFAVGKPVVVEETFPLRCSEKDLDELIGRSGKDAAGWITFYWGKPLDELRASKRLEDAIQVGWLDRFSKRARAAAGRD
jgi:hypothetical protein